MSVITDEARRVEKLTSKSTNRRDGMKHQLYVHYGAKDQIRSKRAAAFHERKERKERTF
jgi:hypothetical protein